ncbi:MAG TPA: cysteine desulfurase family protein [Chthonomonadales bacterium]|nr:cysteine desulfurase family protein [Chthonomonadales bacterium]
MHGIYLDHAATTPLDPHVLDAMAPYFADLAANPSSLHSAGAVAREAVERARASIASVLGADPGEVVFTSGGTESDNWALRGLVAPGGGLVVSAVEHRAVLEPASELARSGAALGIAPVDSSGQVEPSSVVSRMPIGCQLVCVMAANNETGVRLDFGTVGRLCADRGVPLHVDAAQSALYGPPDLRRDPVDLVTLSAHKLYGPKGVGALVARRSLRLRPLLVGGGQEHGLRAGTLNVPGVVGMAAALSIAVERRAADSERVRGLRDKFEAAVLERVDGAEVAGAAAPRLPGHSLLLIEGVDGSALLMALDERGVFASAGAACSSGSAEPSHVLLAMGYSQQRARSAVRFTLGRTTSEGDVECAAAALEEAVDELRALHG